MIQQVNSDQIADIRTVKSPVRSAIFVGLLAAAVCFVWLFLNTHYLYSGNWTSVYYTGALTPMPSELAAEHIYQYPNVVGYDAQFYHLIAHDPLFNRGFARFIDYPRFRYRRIFISGLAALLSSGHDKWVDPAYVAVVLGFVFIGSFWLARWSTTLGFSPAWGLLFLVIPATLVTMLLMIVDGALAALAVGAFWYAERQNQVKLFAVLACACLVREIGVLLLGGYCLWLLFQRKPVRAILFGTAAVPLLLWLWFVQLHTTGDHRAMIALIPLNGLIGAIAGSFNDEHSVLLALDAVAMGGMLLAFGFATYYFLRRETRSPAAFMVAGFIVLGMFVSNEGAIWPEVNSFGRVFSPVILFVAMTGLVQRNWWAMLPIGLVDLRIVTVFLVHLGRILHAMMAGRS